MQIMLCEDDSMFHNGVPTLVVLLVKFDDGKQKRIPYPADRTIAALYQDLVSIAPQVAQDAQQSTFFSEEDIAVRELKTLIPEVKLKVAANHINATLVNSSIIEKEDIVTLVRLDENRDKRASCDLVIGQEYRVISVISTGVTMPGQDQITKIAQGYDVVNDKGDRPERTRVFPHEVALLRKRTSPVINKELIMSEILDCPHCTASNALGLNGSAFEGVCDQCREPIHIERIIKKCLSDKCSNDVSCFDVGGKYAGKCNRCCAVLEVPYA